jgi:hypothetical protein
MDASALRSRVTESLLKGIGDVQYPSVTMMDRVEGLMGTRDDLASYVELLIKKVEASEYPSVSMLDRIGGLLGRLDAVEQQQAQQDRADEDSG